MNEQVAKKMKGSFENISFTGRTASYLNVKAVQYDDCPLKMKLTINEEEADLSLFGEMKKHTPSDKEIEKDEELQWSCVGIYFKRKSWMHSDANKEYTQEEYDYICDCIEKAVTITLCSMCV